MKQAENYIIQCDDPFRAILMHLQFAVQSQIPSVKLLFKWKLPFFYIDGKQPFCYLNCTKTYVDLVFWHGAHLTNHTDKLAGGRKHFKSLRYTTLEEINDTVLMEVLNEAYGYRDRNYK